MSKLDDCYSYSCRYPEDIRMQVYRVISTRSLKIEDFDKQLSKLMEMCQDFGKHEYIESQNAYYDW